MRPLKVNTTSPLALRWIFSIDPSLRVKLARNEPP
jgi:hypothetical protein